MKQKKKVYRYSERIMVENLLVGVLWFFASVCAFVDETLGTIINLLVLAVYGYAMFRRFSSRVENADEMAEQNQNKAEAFAGGIVMLLLALAGIASILFLRDIKVGMTWSKLIPSIFGLCLGIHHVSVALWFKKLEKS